MFVHKIPTLWIRGAYNFSPPPPLNSHLLFQSFSREKIICCRLFCSLDNIYCIFLGSLNNLCSLIKQYGLSKGTNEAMFVVHAYRTLRDRGPYPADQVLKDLDGNFGFVIFDSKAGTVFAALVINLLHKQIQPERILVIYFFTLGLKKILCVGLVCAGC